MFNSRKIWKMTADKEYKAFHEFHITWDTFCPLVCVAEEKIHGMRKGWI